jgi:hypothetical protein
VAEPAISRDRPQTSREPGKKNGKQEASVRQSLAPDMQESGGRKVLVRRKIIIGGTRR